MFHSQNQKVMQYIIIIYIQDTYGPKSKRKRVKLNQETLEGLAD